MIRRQLDYKLSYSFLNNSNWDTDITQSLGLPDELEEHPDKQHIARKLLTAWRQQIQHLHSDNLDYTQAYCNIDFVARRLGLSEAEQAMLRFALHMNRENALRHHPPISRPFHHRVPLYCRHQRSQPPPLRPVCQQPKMARRTCPRMQPETPKTFTIRPFIFPVSGCLMPKAA